METGVQGNTTHLNTHRRQNKSLLELQYLQVYSYPSGLHLSLLLSPPWSTLLPSRWRNSRKRAFLQHPKKEPHNWKRKICYEVHRTWNYIRSEFVVFTPLPILKYSRMVAQPLPACSSKGRNSLDQSFPVSESSSGHYWRGHGNKVLSPSRKLSSTRIRRHHINNKESLWQTNWVDVRRI